MPGIARKGDTDNFGHSIAGGVQDQILIDGIPVAVQGSTMDDGASIVSGVISGVTMNGIPVAVLGSTTSPHPANPGKGSPGSMASVDNGVTAS